MQDAGVAGVQALYVCSMCAGRFERQDNPAALLASASGLSHVEALAAGAACGGGAALHMGVLAVASGAHDIVAVTGVDKMSGRPLAEVEAALVGTASAEDEAALGLTCAGWSALIMRRYMYELSWGHDDFAGFAINAHRNAVANRNAMLRQPLTAEQYRQARVIADPVTLLDVPPVCDGSAAVILCPAEMAGRFARKAVRVTASDLASDTAALRDRADILWPQGAYRSTQAAYAQAGRSPQDIDLFELHDVSTIMAALGLEAAGFAAKGDGVRLALGGAIAREGKIPICTMGGLLARGHAAGASGVYQAVEVVQQLRGEAGANQVDGAKIGMAQSMGGNGACVLTHIFEV
jgi:acetyl-CoA C-acetyltransferase